MQQFAAAIFSGFDIDGEINPSRARCKSRTRFTIRRLKSNARALSVGRGKFQDARRFRGGARNSAIAPFASIEDEARCVNAAAVPVRGVFLLPRHPSFRSIRIAPAEPPSNPRETRSAHNAARDAVHSFVAQPRFCRRTTAATFRGVEFEQMRPGGLAFQFQSKCGSNQAAQVATDKVARSKLVFITLRVPLPVNYFTRGE